jgi:hypothetical protein
LKRKDQSQIFIDAQLYIFESNLKFYQDQGRIKVFAGPGQLAFWGPLDKYKSKNVTLNDAAGEIFEENGPIAKFS